MLPLGRQETLLMSLRLKYVASRSSRDLLTTLRLKYVASRSSGDLLTTLRLKYDDTPISRQFPSFSQKQRKPFP